MARRGSEEKPRNSRLPAAPWAQGATGARRKPAAPQPQARARAAAHPNPHDRGKRRSARCVYVGGTAKGDRTRACPRPGATDAKPRAIGPDAQARGDQAPKCLGPLSDQAPECLEPLLYSRGRHYSSQAEGRLHRRGAPNRLELQRDPGSRRSAGAHGMKVPQGACKKSAVPRRESSTGMSSNAKTWMQHFRTLQPW